ncbi:unnamed protein product [Cochlearia groenlandica]
MNKRFFQSYITPSSSSSSSLRFIRRLLLRSSDSNLRHVNDEFNSRFFFSGYLSGEIDRIQTLDSFSWVRFSCESVLSSSSFFISQDKPIPEEVVDEPVGLSMSEIEIGDNKRCTFCEAKGALLCATCSGTGLYVDSIMESQGIIVKVRCLGNPLIYGRHSIWMISNEMFQGLAVSGSSDWMVTWLARRMNED